jgi:hypothetical protein
MCVNALLHSPTQNLEAHEGDPIQAIKAQQGTYKVKL